MDNLKRRDGELLYFCDEKLFSDMMRARKLTQELNTVA